METPRKFAHLWNDLSSEERHRLMPHVLENQLLHILQCKQKAIKAHKQHMKSLDDWIANIKKELNEYSKEG